LDTARARGGFCRNGARSFCVPRGRDGRLSVLFLRRRHVHPAEGVRRGAALTPGFAFRVDGTDGAARAGLLTTPPGEVPTPTFMPVGTQGSVKGLSPREVAATGARIMLSNTYHLWLRPGAEIVALMGGLHAFARWPHAMLTDSGGYQAFSLAE